MADPQSLSRSGFLAALQLSDGGLPIGRFAHSHGTEEWLNRNPNATPDQLELLVATCVVDGIAPLDGVAVRESHEIVEIVELERLDSSLTMRKLAPTARSASQSCGRQLALLGTRLVDDAKFQALSTRVTERATPGNLAVVEGALARAMQIPVEIAVLLSLRGAAADMIAAAVRLGRLSPSTAQVTLTALSGALDRGTGIAMATSWEQAHSTTPEMEICQLSQTRGSVRFFAS